MSFRVLTLLALAGCAPRTYVVDSPATPDVAGSNDVRVLAQLQGHLTRARACIEEAGSGLLETRFTIQPNGRVTDVEVMRNTSGNPEASRCLSRKIGALYFDPAPAQAMTRTEQLAFCEQGSENACRLGPVHAPDGSHPDRRIVAGVRDLEPRLLACKAEVAPEEVAVLSVELTVSEDGRVASGWVRHASSPELRRCGVAPLLGQSVTEALDAPRQVRFTLGLPAAETQPVARR